MTLCCSAVICVFAVRLRELSAGQLGLEYSSEFATGQSCLLQLCLKLYWTDCNVGSKSSWTIARPLAGSSNLSYPRRSCGHFSRCDSTDAHMPDPILSVLGQASTVLRNVGLPTTCLPAGVGFVSGTLWCAAPVAACLKNPGSDTVQAPEETV